MHGGSHGSGAPKGNQNAFKHGTYTKTAFCQRAELRQLVEESQALLQDLNETND